MKIILNHAGDIPIEDAHNSSGSRRVYQADKQTPSKRVQAMTQGSCRQEKPLTGTSILILKR